MYARWYFSKKTGARYMQCVMQPTAVGPPFHKLEYSYDGGEHEYQNICRLFVMVSSFRVQWPLLYFIFSNRKIEFLYSCEPSDIMVAVAPHTTFNDTFMPAR